MDINEDIFLIYRANPALDLQPGGSGFMSVISISSFALIPVSGF